MRYGGGTGIWQARWPTRPVYPEAAVLAAGSAFLGELRALQQKYGCLLGPSGYEGESYTVSLASGARLTGEDWGNFAEAAPEPCGEVPLSEAEGRPIYEAEQERLRRIVAAEGPFSVRFLGAGPSEVEEG